jgi:cytochrome c1
MSDPRHARYALTVGLALLAAGALSGCIGGQSVGGGTSMVRDGNPQQGRKLIASYGCGSCHTIPGVYTARGVVGPPLYFFGRRTMIAGELPNTPENLARWLRNPRAVEPNTAMPSLGLSQQQAQDIAAYLDTLH